MELKPTGGKEIKSLKMSLLLKRELCFVHTCACERCEIKPFCVEKNITAYYIHQHVMNGK